MSLNDVALLENVQRLYMQRLLHLYRRSMIDVLWSETGMWPLAYRRICFALHYFAKVLLLPEHRIPVWCVEANVTLWTRQKSCWLRDIAVVLRRLSLPESQTSLEALTDARQVVELINALPVLICEKVHDVIEGSTKLLLMQGRIERLPRNGSSKSQWLFRAYHLIRIPTHCIAVTRLITSCHSLAVERGHWLKVVGMREPVPFQFRICHLCKDSVEDELHVLFMCAEDELVHLRAEFLSEMWATYPALKGRSSMPLEMWHTLLAYHDLLPRIGRYVHDILQRVATKELYIDPSINYTT